jgi:hypothetical protein
MHVTQTAIAQCAAQDMAGTWINDDTNGPNSTGIITRVVIDFACNDTNTSHEVDTIRVYGTCSPTLCDWGTASIVTMFWDERKAQYTYAEADYDVSYGYKKIRLFLDPYGKLIVSSLIDYDDGRQDFSSLGYFSK